MVTISCLAHWSIPSITTPPSQVHWHNRYKALQVQLNGNEKDCSSRSEVSLRLNQPTPCIKTASIQNKKKRHFIVTGDFLLRKTKKNPICTLDPLLKESLLPLKVCVKDIRKKLSTPVQPSDYYLLTFFQAGSDEITVSLRAIKKGIQYLETNWLRDQEYM